MTWALALVESPVQLLNVLEWAHARRGTLAAAAGAEPGNEAGPAGAGLGAGPGAGPAHEPVDIAVLPPTDTVGHAQLRLMAGIAGEAGHRVRWYEARASRVALARTAAALAPRMARVRRLVVGDPFSRLVQALLPLAVRARDITVVDDGTATMEFVSLLAEGRPLVRWHRGGRAGPGAIRACRTFTPTAGRSVEVFTSMPAAPPPGVALRRCDFAWTRAHHGPPRVTPGVDIVGTSLVETGVVEEDRYLSGAAALARAQGATRYLAHRREGPAKLARLASLTDLEIVRPELPLELEARRGPIASTVVSFPSTVVHTLPVALRGTGVTVAVCDVDTAWYTPAASPRARAFIGSVAATARELHRLTSVPVAPA